MKQIALILVIYWVFFRRKQCAYYTTQILPDGRMIHVATQDIDDINQRLFKLEQQIKNSSFAI